MLAPWIISHFPDHRIYVEPYGGAASVLLRKPPSEVEVYNDLNGELVGLFRLLRDPEQAAELIRRIELTPWAYDEWDESNTESEDPLENARRLVVCSFMSVGTDAVCRNGKSGFRSYSRVDKIGTVPVQQWRTLPGALSQIVERIQGRVVIENRDALKIMKQHDSKHTLHYVDPPYPKATRGDTGDDYRHEMNDDDHRRLAETLHGLTGAVVLSGYPCELYNELFQGWRYVTKRALADGARERVEALWMKDAVNG